MKSLLNTPQPSGKLARWGMTLQELDLTIEYRTGRKNEKADALSRHPVSGENTVGSDPCCDCCYIHPLSQRVKDPHPLKNDREPIRL